MKPLIPWLLSIACAWLAGHAKAQSAMPPLQFAGLKVCALESKRTIHDCRIAYRTLGTLNADKSNAVLFPTWFGGGSQDLVQYVGADKLIDPAKYFVVLMDSPANGASSSPSNSKTQAGRAFPDISIRDMVEIAHRFGRETWDIRQWHAVVGASMGAMQAFEWAVRHPEAMRHVIAIAGSPRLAPYDIVQWETLERLLDWRIDCQCETPLAVWSGIRYLRSGESALTAPHDKLAEVRKSMAASAMSVATAHDRIRQLRAMVGHNVARDDADDLAQAARRIRAKLMIVLGGKDIIVTPGPAREFARLSGATLLEIDDCGHDVGACGAARLFPQARAFLEERP